MAGTEEAAPTEAESPQGLSVEGCVCSRILEAWPGSWLRPLLPETIPSLAPFARPGATLTASLGHACFFGFYFTENISLVCCWTPVIPALRRQSQKDCFEFEASHVLQSKFRTTQSYTVRFPSQVNENKLIK